jgi:hypothetical protein
MAVIIFAKPVTDKFYKYTAYDYKKDFEKANEFIFMDDAKIYSEPIKTKAVEGFDLRKNTLPFRNFGSQQSADGVCLGYAFFEKFVFMESLEKKIEGAYDVAFINKNLGDYHLNNNAEKVLFGTSSITEKQDGLLQDSKGKKIVPIEDVYKLANKELLDSFKGVESQEIREILKAINYIKTKQSLQMNGKLVFYKKTNTDYNTTIMNDKGIAASLAAGIFDKNFIKIRNAADPDDIKRKIDNNELIVIGIRNKLSGHAVLGYKYEEFADGTIKCYVKDSNIPLFEDKPEFENINKDIENTYILFKTIDGEVHYKYIPSINGHILYQGNFNSFSPESSLYIF